VTGQTSSYFPACRPSELTLLPVLIQLFAGRTDGSFPKRQFRIRLFHSKLRVTMNSLKHRAQVANRAHGLMVTGFKCPSCNMVAWHADEFATEILCPFCSNALPRYVTQISPQRMLMMDATDQSNVEKQLNDSTRRNPTRSVEREERGSPFVLEFFMVQGSGFICMAYRNHDGKWRGAFGNMELPGAIRVLE
jgi:hypothetical protein